jgi:hypothetical protein
MAPSGEAPRDLADRVIRQALQHPANSARSCIKPCPRWPSVLAASAAVVGRWDPEG